MKPGKQRRLSVDEAVRFAYLMAQHPPSPPLILILSDRETSVIRRHCQMFGMREEVGGDGGGGGCGGGGGVGRKRRIGRYRSSSSVIYETAVGFVESILGFDQIVLVDCARSRNESDLCLFDLLVESVVFPLESAAGLRHLVPLSLPLPSVSSPLFPSFLPSFLPSSRPIGQSWPFTSVWENTPSVN